MKRFSRATLAPLVLSLVAVDALAASYKFTNIVDTTTLAPNGTFAAFGAPSISENTVAFIGSYPPGRAIFTGSGGPLTTIVKSGDPGPVGPFGFFGAPAISGNVVAFHDLFADVLQSSGIFVGDGTSITTIAFERDPAPQGTFFAFGDPSISAGTVAFVGRFGSGSSFEDGIFTGSGGPLTTVVTPGDVTPPAPFNDAGAPSTSDNTVAFLGYDHGLPGIYTGSGGPLATIAKFGDPAPFGIFTSFASPALSGNVVAFIGGSDAGNGIFTSSGGAPTVIVTTGDPAPIGTFVGFQSVSFDGSTVAYLGRYGDFDVESIQTAIFTSTGGDTTTVLRYGDPLFGSSAIDFDLGRFGLDPEGSGNLAFNYALADGRRGIALATIVPEPPAFLLSGVIVTSVCLSRRVPPRTARRPTNRRTE